MRALIDQRLVQPDPFAPLQHHLGRDPRLGQLARAATARAAAWRRCDRSWRAACGPAPPGCRPARPHAPRTPRRRSPRPRTANPCSPPPPSPPARRSPCSATSSSNQRRNRSRSGCHTRPRHTSPDSTSNASKVIWPRCRSNPHTMLIRDLLDAAVGMIQQPNGCRGGPACVLGPCPYRGRGRGQAAKGANQRSKAPESQVRPALTPPLPNVFSDQIRNRGNGGKLSGRGTSLFSPPDRTPPFPLTCAFAFSRVRRAIRQRKSRYHRSGRVHTWNVPGYGRVGLTGVVRGHSVMVPCEDLAEQARSSPEEEG